MSEEQTINYSVKKLERCVCATCAFGKDSFNAPYYSVYFIVNNSGIITVYDKSMPTKDSVGEGKELYLDQLGNAATEMKPNQNKYEVMEFIYEELGRIGEKMQREGRPLADSDISKLLTKLGSKYGAKV